MAPQSVRVLQLISVILLGLSYFGRQIDARAVNVSNTWTMPQEGLNVFYRFFRDRISWFEADAVCQFHHANLVTVDNSFQFDATRDLLRELDVNDIVWIGLMRPQSSERFMWSNSRPLVTDTGYWAESLPLMDAPLCAVIDPIRDYRWHALRCGGPETASFLCEMPVPSWADACILKDMPNLTMQYMADTASIELIRNCAEEGLLKQSCKGKQDRDRALRELICPRERLEAQRINDITNSHFKSLQIINSIRTDNNENNNIELLPLGEASYSSSSDITEQVPTEKNTVQRLIEQFNVDDLMQADEPSISMTASGGNHHIPDEIPKPVKKSTKKVIVANDGAYEKKSRALKYEDKIHLSTPTIKPKKQKQQPIALEDIMMGDQPQESGEPEMLEHVGAEDDEVSNEIIEPLPHKKKILPQDLKTMAPITERSSEDKWKDAEQKKDVDTISASISASTIAPTTTTTTTTAATITTTAAKSTPTTTSETTTISTAATTTTALRSTVKLHFAPSTVMTTMEVNAEIAQPTQQKISSHLNTEKFVTTTYTPLTTIIIPSSSIGPSLANEKEAHSSHTDSAASSSSSPLLSKNIHSTPNSNEFHFTESTTEAPVTIGHPMHPQQQQPQQHGIVNEELQHSHIVESVDNSHFIPPMLLVKSHYIPSQKHVEHNMGTEHHFVGGMHEEHDMAHKGRTDHKLLTAGKANDNPVYPSMTANNSPHSHRGKPKTDESVIETITATTVTTTTETSTKSAITTNEDDELTKKTTDEKEINLKQKEQQQQQELNAEIIHSASGKTNQQQRQQQQQQQQQQQHFSPTNTKSPQTLDNVKEIAKKIENSKGIVANKNEHATITTTISPITTTSASVTNKFHSTLATKVTPTNTTTAATTPPTTMKIADVGEYSVTHDIEKPVAKDVEKLSIEMPANINKMDKETMLITQTTTAATTNMDELMGIEWREAETKQKIVLEDPKSTTKIEAEAVTAELGETTTTTVKPPPSATLTIKSTGLPSSSTLATLTTTIMPTDTMTTTTTTMCNSEDIDDESTKNKNISDESTTSDDVDNGGNLKRVRRICKPHHVKNNSNNNKHAKHHDKVIEPATPTPNFLKEETETPPYKPNRHRVLTKPETVSYFKKIIG